MTPGRPSRPLSLPRGHTFLIAAAVVLAAMLAWRVGAPALFALLGLVPAVASGRRRTPAAPVADEALGEAADRAETAASDASQAAVATSDAVADARRHATGAEVTAARERLAETQAALDALRERAARKRGA